MLESICLLAQFVKNGIDRQLYSSWCSVLGNWHSVDLEVMLAVPATINLSTVRHREMAQPFLMRCSRIFSPMCAVQNLAGNAVPPMLQAAHAARHGRC